MPQIDLSSLLVENEEEDDLVKFSFPNEKRKIKCSISLLTEVSPVFETMFSTKWNKPNTIEMDDFVQFNQFNIFKFFVEILYGLNKEDLLTISEAIDVYFYSHKYQVRIVNDRVLSYITDKIEVGWPSTNELQKMYTFIQLFGLDDLMVKLDQMELELNNENCYEFYKLTEEMNLAKMKTQIIEFCGKSKIDPKWPPEFLFLVASSLQQKAKVLEERIKVFEDKENQNNAHRGKIPSRPR